MITEPTTPAEALKIATLKLKHRVVTAVEAAIKDFEDEIGMSPSAIDVPLIDVTTHGDRFTKRGCGIVKVSFDEL